MRRTPLTLAVSPPFDVDRTLDFLKSFRASAVDRSFEPRAFSQALMVHGEVVVARLESSGSTAAPRLAARLYSQSPLAPQMVAEVGDRLRFQLGLEDDLRPFYQTAQLDDAFRPVLERLYGFHLVRFTTPFEAACWALVRQRTPTTFAYRTMRNLVLAFGSGLEFEGRLYRAFPEPLAVLGQAPEGSPEARAGILAATRNVRKTERLVAVARAFAAADERFLRTAPYDEVHAWLTSVQGLGQWSADYILLRGLGRTERLPWSDTELVAAVSRVYAGGLSLSRKDVEVLAGRYGDYQGYWLHYLKLFS